MDYAAHADRMAKFVEHQRKSAELLREFADLQREMADRQAASAAYMKSYARNASIAAGLLCFVGVLSLLRLFL